MNTETQTLTLRFTETDTSERILSMRVSVTLDDSRPFTDFSDEAWEQVFAKYPDAEMVDED